MAEQGNSAGTKRRRVDFDPVEDQELWLSDGNIVIAATDETDEDKTTYVFRVHKSILAKQSTVFQDLFTLPQASSAEQYQGIPLVILPDSYESVKGLLQILYDPSGLPTPTTDPLEWGPKLQSLQGPLRLAAKYQLVTIHERLSALCMRLWPTTLAGFDEKWDKIEQHELAEPFRAASARCRNVMLPHAACAIALAETAELPGILPAAFYELSLFCSSTPPEALEQGVGSESLEEHLYSLNPPNMTRLMEGGAWLRSTTIKLITSTIPITFHNKGSYVCGNRGIEGDPDSNSTCLRHSRDWWTSSIISGARLSLLVGDPIRGLKVLVDELERDLEHHSVMCKPCKDVFVQVLQACRRYLWDELPFFFRLESREPGLAQGVEQYLNDI